MRLDICTRSAPAASAGRTAPGWRAFSLAVSLAVLIFAGVAQAGSQPHAAEPQAHGEAAAHEEAHDEGLLPTVARLFNFAILAGVLVYFLRAPLTTHVASRRTQIRQDLVTAAEMRTTAAAQLAAIEEKLAALPGELDALRARGAEDVTAERARIEQAAALDRERLLEHTRREIAMQLRMARRDLTEYAAQLAVDIAHARIVRTITPDDQLRLVDRYAAQLKEAR